MSVSGVWGDFTFRLVGTSTLAALVGREGWLPVWRVTSSRSSLCIGTLTTFEPTPPLSKSGMQPEYRGGNVPGLKRF